MESQLTVLERKIDDLLASVDESTHETAETGRKTADDNALGTGMQSGGSKW